MTVLMNVMAALIDTRAQGVHMRSSRPLIRWTSSCLALIAATAAGVVGLTASPANAESGSYGLSYEMVTFDDTTVAQGQLVTIRVSVTPPPPPPDVVYSSLETRSPCMTLISGPTAAAPS